jgi:hypothetical protein
LSILRCGDNDEENSQSLFFRLGQGGLDVVSIFKEREAILEEKSPILVTSITSSSEYSLIESRGGGRRVTLGWPKWMGMTNMTSNLITNLTTTNSTQKIALR